MSSGISLLLCTRTNTISIFSECNIHLASVHWSNRARCAGPDLCATTIDHTIHIHNHEKHWTFRTVFAIGPLVAFKWWKYIFGLNRYSSIGCLLPRANVIRRRHSATHCESRRVVEGGDDGVATNSPSDFHNAQTNVLLMIRVRNDNNANRWSWTF